MKTATAVKPTIRANDTASMRALREGHNYTIARTSAGWAVRKKGSGSPYHVTVDGACDCSHFRQRLEGTGEPCKHFAMANLAELLGKVQAPAPSAWSEKSPEERRRAMFGPDDL